MSQLSAVDPHNAAVLKALVLGAGTPDHASRPGGEVGAVFASLGALEPPYDPEALGVMTPTRRRLVAEKLSRDDAHRIACRRANLAGCEGWVATAQYVASSICWHG